MFYIKTLNGTNLVLTVPPGTESRAVPTMEVRDYARRHNPKQLWKFVPSTGAYLLIQNYDKGSGGPCIDCRGGTPGKELIVFGREDGNDNQKFYIQRE